MGRTPDRDLRTSSAKVRFVKLVIASGWYDFVSVHSFQSALRNGQDAEHAIQCASPEQLVAAGASRDVRDKGRKHGARGARQRPRLTVQSSSICGSRIWSTTSKSVLGY